MSIRLLRGDMRETLATLEPGSVQACITSPPYWNLRDYGTPALKWGAWLGSLGLEPTPELYVEHLVECFRAVRRVLHPSGTVWLNLGSSYASGDTRPSLSQQPQRVPAYGTDDTRREGWPDLDCVYSYLCDECLAGFQNHRSAGTLQLPELAPSRGGLKDRDNGPAGSAVADLDASALGALLSTRLESWLQFRGECSRCASRAALYQSLQSPSFGDVLESARTAEYRTGSAQNVSAARTLGTGVSGSARGNYTSTARRYKPKDLVPIPWLVAIALQDDGWYLRSDVIWSKPSPMPESVQDRPTRSHEYLFLLSKSRTYYYDADAIREPDAGLQGGSQIARAAGDARYVTDQFKRPKERGAGDKALHTTPYTGMRNKRSVWEIATQPYSGAHFAVMPDALVEPCIKASTSEKGQCPECGVPWGRVTEVDRENRSNAGKAAARSGVITLEGKGHPSSQVRPGHDIRLGPSTTTFTTGWRPSCKHTADPVPQVVLDPFAGSGTVGLVADRLGRNAVLCELSDAYCDLGTARLVGDAPLFVDLTA